MLKGNVLTKNSTIGILAPASPESKDFIFNQLKIFKSLYFKNIKLSTHIFDRDDYLAGKDQDRASDINDMFKDNSIDGIVCLRGGYGSLRILKYLDDDIIKNNPKFFCGFSDITLLLDYFKELGLISFHGPMINSNLTDPKTLKSFLSICHSNSKNYYYDLNSYNNLHYINNNNFSGQIIGGNLATICSSIGTPYQMKPNNSILFLEEVNEEPYVIDRMLTKLLYCNFFNSCNAIIVGHVNKSKLFDLSYKKELQKVFIKRLGCLNLPLIVGFPFGHDYPNITIPIGCNAHYDKCKNKLYLNSNFLI